MWRPLVACAALLGLCACNADGSSKGAGPAGSRPAIAADTAKATKSAAPEPPPAPKPSAAPLLKDVAATPAPSIDEWKQAKRLRVKDADRLGCVAEGVREWVRVSCRKPSIGGGNPATVTVLGDSKGILTFAKGGVTSVQFRFGRGFELNALFTFGGLDNVMPLTIRWPRDVPQRPSTIGSFAGVPKVTEAEHKKACECLDDMFRPGCAPGFFAPECLRTIEETLVCTTLLDCQNLAPNGLATCSDSEAHDGVCPTCRCSRTCKTDADCPTGQSCGGSFQREKVLVCL